MISKHRTIASVCTASILLLTTSLTTSLAQSSLNPLNGENARDIERVTGTTIQQANRLRAIVTIDAVRNLMPHLTMTADDPLDEVLAWHLVAENVTAVDHTCASGATILCHEQFGPHRTSRALAIVNLAIFEAANAFAPPGSRFISYVNAKTGATTIGAPPANADDAAAVIEAAYGTLLALYPGQQATLQMQHDATIAMLPNTANVSAGRSFGEGVAAAVLALRQGDGSDLPEPRWNVDFVPAHPAVGGVYPAGQWQIDPVSNIAVALGGNWPHVKPFVLSAANQFRDTLPLPPNADLSNTAYNAAYVQVRDEGGDPTLDTKRNDTATREHYFWAKFWAYDATAGLCAPVRLYNQIADEILEEYTTMISPHYNAAGAHAAAASEVARYHALLNIAMADAAIAAWDAKYYFQYWRPVTGIRYEQAKAASTTNHEWWYPLGAQQTNSTAVINITPPFPAYPSGHAVFGGALFQTLRLLVPHDHGFNFQSDEFNGKNRPKDSSGQQQPNVDVYNFIRCQDGDNTNPTFCGATPFPSFDYAEMANAESRVWMGVHWEFDATNGTDLGKKIGATVYNAILKPQP